jgi:RHS repeat-associated protein
MDTHKKQQIQKSIGALLRWLALSLLFAGTHVLAQTGGTVTYVYTDPQGTPLAEADASGNITATFEYTPYGTYAPQGTSTPGPAPQGPGYTGHVNDPETNLVYMQARYYDSTTGRFLSVDPIGPASSRAYDFARYVYAHDNPVINEDPNGQFPGDGMEVDCQVYQCHTQGTDPGQVQRSSIAMDEANAALKQAGTLQGDSHFTNVIDIVTAWSDAVTPIANRLKVELGSTIYDQKNTFFTSPAYSTGDRYTIRMQDVNLHPMGGVIGEIHAHTINRTFSGDQGWATYDRRLGSSYSDARGVGDLQRYYLNKINGYVSLPNGTIYGWNYGQFQDVLDQHGGTRYLRESIFTVRSGN